jgi:hypothetical protein
MSKKTARELILDVLKEKACLKQKVYHITHHAFKALKANLKEIALELNESMLKVDSAVIIEFVDRGDFEARLKLGGDTLVFMMHTNVFQFERSHGMWSTSYVKDDELRSYCGMISVYNFLSDSFKYNRVNDLGYMIARIFINKDEHFFVEGKRQLGFLYNDFNRSITEEDVRSIIESGILYSLDFDLYTPPYQAVQEISVDEVIEVSQINKMKTGKRLGFKFQTDGNEIR